MNLACSAGTNAVNMLLSAPLEQYGMTKARYLGVLTYATRGMILGWCSCFIICTSLWKFLLTLPSSSASSPWASGPVSGNFLTARLYWGCLMNVARTTSPELPRPMTGPSWAWNSMKKSRSKFISMNFKLSILVFDKNNV